MSAREYGSRAGCVCAEARVFCNGVLLINRALGRVLVVLDAEWASPRFIADRHQHDPTGGGLLLPEADFRGTASPNAQFVHNCAVGEDLSAVRRSGTGFKAVLANLRTANESPQPA